MLLGKNIPWKITPVFYNDFSKHRHIPPPDASVFDNLVVDIQTLVGPFWDYM